ncbi:transposase, partial [Cerasicoccus arenae]
MKKNGKRFQEEQIIYALRQVEGGRKIADVYREVGVSEQSFHRWKRQYADRSIRASKVADALDLAARTAGALPQAITVDNGPEFAG